MSSNTHSVWPGINISYFALCLRMFYVRLVPCMCPAWHYNLKNVLSLWPWMPVKLTLRTDLRGTWITNSKIVIIMIIDAKIFNIDTIRKSIEVTLEAWRNISIDPCSLYRLILYCRKLENPPWWYTCAYSHCSVLAVCYNYLELASRQRHGN